MKLFCPLMRKECIDEKCALYASTAIVPGCSIWIIAKQLDDLSVRIKEKGEL